MLIEIMCTNFAKELGHHLSNLVIVLNVGFQGSDWDLVNCQQMVFIQAVPSGKLTKPWKITMFHGKTEYFDGHGFQFATFFYHN